MGLIASLKTWVDNEILTAADLNANFSELRTRLNSFAAFKDLANTFTPAQTFQNGVVVTGGGVSVGGGGVSVTGNSTITGTLGGLTGLSVASGGAAIVGNASVTGNLSVTGTVTGGTITVPAAGVQPGSFSAGNFVVTGTLTGTSLLTSGGQLRAARITQTGAGGSVSFATANHVRHTMTGNGTLTLSGGVAGGIYTVEVLQDGTGGRTVAWSGATWSGGVAPAATTAANRKDVYTFYFDGTAYLGVLFGQNFASTA